MDDYNELRILLDRIESENIKLARQVETYSRALQESIDAEEEWADKWTQCNIELTNLKSQLEFIRKEWASEWRREFEGE